MKYSVQEYLSLGYVYLLVVGVISNSIFYQFLGINILTHSTLLDVLISPVAIMANDYRIVIYFSVIGFLGYLYFVKLMPSVHRKYRDNPFYQKWNNVEKLDKRFAQPADFHATLTILAFVVFSLFVGFGLGRGNKLKNKIANNKVEMTHRITFADQTTTDAYVVGQNSLYVFFVRENATKVSVSPIASIVKEIVEVEKGN